LPLQEIYAQKNLFFTSNIYLFFQRIILQEQACGGGVMPYSRSSRDLREEQRELHFREMSFRSEGEADDYYPRYAKEEIDGYEDDEFM
jgi:hypothetical protein